MCFVRKITSIAVLFLFIYLSFFYNAYAIRIVAIVGDNVITDYDVEKLGKMLCKIDKRLKCNSMENTQMSMITLAETYLKMEHYKQSKIDLSNFLNDYNKYKDSLISNLKLNKNDISEQFNDYLFAEFIWNVMISSQLKDRKITDKEIKDYANEKKIKINNSNKILIKNEIMQNEYNKQSAKMIKELKKIYFVDIKG